MHLAPFFGDRSMDAIPPEDVLDLVAVLEGKGLSPKSIQNVIATLSALFNFARAPQRRWATANPCEGVELPAVPESEEIRFLTLDEVDALVEHARAGRVPGDRPGDVPHRGYDRPAAGRAARAPLARR